MSSVTLFQGNTGATVRLVGQAGTKADIGVTYGQNSTSKAFSTSSESLNKLFVNFHAIVTDITIEEAANANAMYAADGRIYMHVPGDKLGSAILSGIAFDMACSGDADQTDEYKGDTLVKGAEETDIGIVRMLKWYRKHRISNPEVVYPLCISLPTCQLYAYLASFSSRVIDVTSHIYNFTLPMYLIPEDVNV
jgi:hypothetical protein